MTSDWFQRLTGFPERTYADTRVNLGVEGSRLFSRVNGLSYSTGSLETPTLGELRARAESCSPILPGKLQVSDVVGNVRRIHGDRANEHALFQVASQFNLLEMTGPDLSPEDGVSRYAIDRTQGPACAIAAGAATIYRNYFAPVGGVTGQTADRQIDCLSDVGTLLGNENGALWEMKNGYALCTEEGLAKIESKLLAMDGKERDGIRNSVRIGLHWNVEVTDSEEQPYPLVSQAFCSALPLSYTRIPAHRWEAFATLILESAYEATIWAAVLNRRYHDSNVVFLTRLGGGAFGNDPSWIEHAMQRALGIAANTGLDVRLVSYG